jgi:hypothetical protein
MLEEAFCSSVWLTIAVWVAIYASDYYLTIVGARIYDAAGRRHVRFQGSYELNPLFQKDVDARRLFSFRWIAMLLLSAGCIWLLWFLAVERRHQPELYSFSVGCLFLLSFAANMRHARNILVFRWMKNVPAPENPFEYPRRLMLRYSAMDRLLLAVVFLTLALVTSSWFVFGGSASCAVVALKQWRLSRRFEAGMQGS